MAAKVAVALAAVTVAGGASYEGVQQIREPAAPAKASPANVAPAQAEKAGRAKELAAKAAAKAAKAQVAPKASNVTKRARTPVPTGRPIASRSTDAKLPGSNGRNASAPGLAKAIGKTERPPLAKTPSGKSAAARLRAGPAAKPIIKVPTQAKHPDPQQRRVAPAERERNVRK
ncbi:MAG: hypothetical protein H0V94_08665 [Actinobacteria bacterium]|nr:hypothetical protein [Actinomycetota bacterium]